MLNKVSIICVGLLLVPGLVMAQLTSESYRVEGSGVSTGGTSLTGSSTSFTSETETGGLFLQPVAVTSPPTSPGKSSGSRRNNPKSATEPLVIQTAPVLIGPISALVDTPFTLLVYGPAKPTAVIFAIDGVQIAATELLEGYFSVTHTPTSVGVLRVTAIADGNTVAQDTDGKSDGVLLIPVQSKEPNNAPVSIPLPTKPALVPETEATTSMPVPPGRVLQFDYGITDSCHVAFTWEKGESVSIYKRDFSVTEPYLLATINSRMPWFIDSDVSTETEVFYELITRSGKTASVSFASADFDGCVPDTTSVQTLDIDEDENDEFIIDDIFLDVDGSSMPLALAGGGIILDTDNDEIADTYWNVSEDIAYEVVDATDRLITIQKGAEEIVVTYEPLTESGYDVSLARTGSGRVLPVAKAAVLGALSLTEPVPAEPEPASDLHPLLLLMGAVGFGVGLLMTLLRSMNIPFSVSSFAYAFTHGARFVFSSFVFWRKRRPWGTVYDSVTKAPVDPAYVQLFDMQGNSVADAITDLDGRYGFLVPEGQYEMSVRKVNYTFPAAHQPVSGLDVLYSNLYFGGVTAISDTVTHDIPMDPVKFDWNQYEKMRTKQTKFIHRFDPFIAVLFEVLFFVGAAIMVWQFYNSPDWVTGVLLFVYVVMLLLRLYRGKSPLYGNLKRKGRPLAHALIAISRQGVNITTRVADVEGRYVAIVPPGVYEFSVSERVSETGYEEVFTKKVNAKKGYINMNVRV